MNSYIQRQLFCVLAAVVLTTACQTLDRQQPMNPRSEKKLMVTDASLVHRIAIPTGATRLDDATGRKLSEFLLRSGALQSGSDIQLAARTADVSARTLVAREMTLRTINAARIRPQFDDAGLGENDVRITVTRSVVTLPACPDWTSQSGRTLTNQAHSNWGCATAINLGRMVDRPRDLVEGRADGVADGDALTLGIQRYRAGETRPLAVSDGNTGDTYGGTGAPSQSGGGAQ